MEEKWSISMELVCALLQFNLNLKELEEYNAANMEFRDICKVSLPMSCSLDLPQSVPGQASTHHTFPPDTDAVGILVGAASPVVHRLLHMSHIPCFSGLAVQVTSLGSCGAREKKELDGGQ